MGEKENLTSSCAVERGQTGKAKGSEEKADLGGLLATQNHGDVQTKAVLRAVSGPMPL